MQILPKSSGTFIKDYYNNLRIKDRFFLTNLVLVIVVCVISLLVIQITLTIYQRVLYQEVAKELNFSAISLENELDQIERYSFEIITDDNIQMFLNDIKNNHSVAKRTRSGRLLSDKLWSMTFERNIISVNIIDIQGNQYSGGAPISPEHLQYFTDVATKKKGAMEFLEPFDDGYIICVRQIRKIQDLGLDPLGTLIIRVNTPSVVKQVTAGSMDNGINLIVRSDRKFIYAASPILRDISERLTYRRETDYQIDRIDGHSYFVSFIRSNYTHWTYINILPIQTIFKQISIMRNIVLIVFAILLIVVLMIGMRFARNMTTPIENLSRRMKQVQNGDFSIDNAEMASRRNDEIGDLEKDFCIMVDKINDLINENYVKQILIKNAQLKALRANINPHFLYNTLESINWLAKTNHQQEISIMVESLGRLLRSAISDQDQLTTIREEIRLLDDYLAIQKIRFKDRLDFRLTVEDKWHDVQIPRLSIQPIVENSIIYGLEKKAGVCRISVRFIEDNKSLLAIVEDDGPGISQDVLAKIRTWQYEPSGLGIGLKNIDDRYKLIYGDAYGIDIESQPDAWTRVTLRIPLIEDGYV